jgi:hypothetical protein
VTQPVEYMSVGERIAIWCLPLASVAKRIGAGQCPPSGEWCGRAVWCALRG